MLLMDWYFAILCHMDQLIYYYYSFYRNLEHRDHWGSVVELSLGFHE